MDKAWWWLPLLVVATVSFGCGDGVSASGGSGGAAGDGGNGGAPGTFPKCERTRMEFPLDLWDAWIESYEARDADDPPAPGQVVFIGSSNIALWETLPEDLLPVPALNRGFGGSVLAQATHYIDRIVLPYEPSAVVLSSGTNDLNFGGSAECVFEDYRGFIAEIRDTSPSVPIYFISIEPTPARRPIWDEMQRANAFIEAYIAADDTLRYIDISAAVLGENGEPDESLFIEDRQHKNPLGYEAWAAIIRPILESDLGL